MSENLFEESSLSDYYKIENLDDYDLQSQLYAKIYYESNIEGESRPTDVPRPIHYDDIAVEMDVEPKRVELKSTHKQRLKYETTRGSFAAEPSVCDDTLRAQNTANFYMSVQIREQHSMGSVQSNRDKLSDGEMNYVICNNTNNNVLGDSLVREVRGSEENFSRKRKFSNIGNICNINKKDPRDILSKSHVLSKYEKQILLAEQNEDKQISVSSDSEESILEVPIPPKPKPPLVNLQDSDEDNAINSGMNEDDQSSEVSSNCQDLFYIDINKPQFNDTLVDSNINVQIPLHEQEIRENIILNYRTTEKDVGSISEIQQLSMMAEMNQNQYVSPEYISQSSKKKSPQKSKKNNTNVQQSAQNITPYHTFVENIRSRKGYVKHNVRYFRHEDQNDTLLETSSNDLIRGGKRQYSEVNRNCKQKRQCNITQNNINITLQVSNDTEERNESFNDEEERNVQSSYVHFKPMSEDMRNYYYDSTRGQENFDVSELQRDMTRDPRRWKILDSDLMPCPPSKQRMGSRIRCNNCHQEGHHRYKCLVPRRTQTCYICGIKGHNESRCPQKMCLTCGKQQNTFHKTCKYCRVLYCTMCNSTGHERKDCPDLWRRYHQTTDMNDTPQNPSNVMKPSSMLHCCNCTKRGHESSKCREFRWSLHFPTPAAVTNYTDGPIYMPDTASSSEHNTKRILSPITTDNVTSIPQNPKNMQPAMEEYLKLPINVNALTSSTNADRIQTSQEPVEKEDLISYATVNEAHLPEERQNKYRENGVNEQEFVHIIFSVGQFHNKNKKDARMIVKNILTSNLTHYGKIFVNNCMQNLYKYQVFNPVFLKKLYRKQIEFEVIIGTTTCQPMTITVQLTAMKDYADNLYTLLIHWINLPDDEKDYGVDVSLPTVCTRMFNLLSDRAPQLEKMHFTCYEQLIGGFNDPRWLFNSIQHEKSKLKQHKGNLARKDQRYSCIRRNLTRLQTKLLMIVNTEPMPNVYVCMFQNALKNLEKKRNSKEKLDPATYIKLLLLYNRLFAPHTPSGVFRTLRCFAKHEKIMEKSLHLPQVHQESQQEIIYEEENFAYDNINPALLPPATSCASQDTNYIENPLTINIQHSLNDNVLIERNNVSDISSKISDTTDHNSDKIIVTDNFVERNSQIVLLNTEPVSVQSEHPGRSEGQLPTSNVNNKFNIVADTQHIKKKLTKKQKKNLKKKMRQEGKIDFTKSNIYNRLAPELIKEARAFGLLYMTNAADELQRNMNNRMIMPKHIQAMQKMIKLEKKYRRNCDLYSQRLKA